MTDVNETLNELAQLRASFQEFRDAVDADLAAERQRRLAVRQGEIVDAIARAYVGGASINAIKRAYGTKDYRTIKNIIDSMEEQIAFMRQQQEQEEETVRTDWFSITNGYVSTGDSSYEIFELEDGEYLLTGDGEMDGWILTENDEDERNRVLFKAVSEALA